MNEVNFFRIVDRESTNPIMSNNGGDYDFGRTVAVRDGVPVAVRYWTSADFDYCPHSGTFNRCEERNGCGEPAPMHPSDVEGWQSGELLAGEDAERAQWRFEQGSRFFRHFSPAYV
jgi:hypothetical protein